MNATQAHTREPVRFFYNGWKLGTGKIQTGYWSLCTDAEGEYYLALYCKWYKWDHSTVVRAGLGVLNGSDALTDYFESDRLTFRVDDEMFPAAARAARKSMQKSASRCAAKGETYWAEHYTNRAAILAELEELAK